MNFLFVAPRFHTNQYHSVKALIEKGNTVNYLVQYIGFTESHDIIKPVLMKNSFISKLIFLFLDAFYNKPYKQNKKMSLFIPSYFKTKAYIKKINPDIIIMRDRSLCNLVITLIAKQLRIKTLLYNQTPIYTDCNYSSKQKLLFHFFPKTRITPVIGLDKTKNRDKNAYFVPFTIKSSISERTYKKNSSINILNIGKFQYQKNQLLLVKAIENLKDKYNLKLTIVGEVSNSFHKEYYDNITSYINENKLNDCVTLIKNVPYNEIKKYYLENDIFVLSSINELASVSILESMSYGLATISSDVNGTAHYIRDGYCGYIFKNDNLHDLINKIELIIDNGIENMGNNALKHINENFSYDCYYKQLMEAINNI